MIIDESEVQRYNQEACTYQVLVEFIIKFFKDPIKNFKGKLKKEKKQLEDGKLDFLICFDNAEDLIENNQEQFQSLLQELTENCPTLKIVITSNKPLQPNSNLKVHQSFISGLKSKRAVELFLDILDRNRLQVSP